MAWVALTCPQCSAPLPRVALWRSVKCASCGALITRTEAIVERETFRQALLRSRQGAAYMGQSLRCGGQEYGLLQHLGSGEVSQVYLAQRIGPFPLLATVKVSTNSSAAAHYQREAHILRDLQALHGSPGDDFYSQLLPEVIVQGAVEDQPGKHALVLTYPHGFWGSLASLHHHFPQGLDPRHAIWIWRRLLEMLGYIHSRGWSHGDVRPEHALVHPRDHAARLIGWTSAQARAGSTLQAQDLMHSARIILMLLNGANGNASTVLSSVPTELAQLVLQASQEPAFSQQHGAQGIDTQLKAAARSAYGPPAFVPLIL